MSDAEVVKCRLDAKFACPADFACRNSRVFEERGLRDLKTDHVAVAPSTFEEMRQAGGGADSTEVDRRRVAPDPKVGRMSVFREPGCGLDDLSNYAVIERENETAFLDKWNEPECIECAPGRVYPAC